MEESKELSSISVAGAEATPSFVASRRWLNYLQAESKAFQQLQEERERGWKSVALDKWYAQRWAASSAPTAAPSESKSFKENPNSKPESHSTTHFVMASVKQLADRYKKHAWRTWANRHVSRAFTPMSGVRAGKHSREGEQAASSSALGLSFLDFGAAPGGVSCFLTQTLEWSGVGVSLEPEKEGGIGMHPDLIALHRESIARYENKDATKKQGEKKAAVKKPVDYFLYYGDVMKEEKTWKREGLETDGRESASLGALADFTALADHQHRFLFVNGGAVQDYGQREQTQSMWREESERKSSPGDGEMTGELVQHRQEKALLPWFTLLLPQLRLCLRYVSSGGTIMLVYGVTHCASFFIFLHLLRLSLGPRVRVRVCETMHLSKSPVYVVCEGVESEKGAQEMWLKRQEELLATMDPSSPVVVPSFLFETFKEGERSFGASSSVSGSGVGRTPVPTLRSQKEAFWLGESEEGWRAACAGFSACRRDVEAIWEKTRDFLSHRRQLAEAAEERKQQQAEA